MKRLIVIALLAIALLFVLAGIGATVFFTANAGFRTNDPFDRQNISSVLEEHKTLQVDAGEPLTLRVDDAAGDVSITGADVDTVQIEVVKTAYDSSQARADAEVQDIEYTVEQDGNAITLNYELPSSMNFSNNVNTVDFVVTLPHEVTVDVATSGEVSVANTIGNVDVSSGFGEVRSPTSKAPWMWVPGAESWSCPRSQREMGTSFCTQALEASRSRRPAATMSP
jgi:hypothetical protein